LFNRANTLVSIVQAQAGKSTEYAQGVAQSSYNLAKQIFDQASADYNNSVTQFN
jgi:hypothetical protein